MKKIILSLLLACFCITSTIGAAVHLCPGCQPNSEAACTMHQPALEKESCHTPVQTKQKSCCENSSTAEKTDSCELSADIDEPAVGVKFSETTPKSKIQLDTIISQSYSRFEPRTVSPEVHYQIGLRGSPPSSALLLLKSVRLLC